MTPNPPAASPWWLAPAVIAGLLAVMIGVITLIVNGRRARNDRQRELFASAFGDVAGYCEFPYIVRRRRHDLPEEERLRISTELSEVQRKLNHNRAVLRVEAPHVAKAYRALVETTKIVAGGAIRDGWNQDAVTSGGGVHVTDVDLAPIVPFEDAFLLAAADHLALTPRWARAACRSLARKVHPADRWPAEAPAQHDPAAPRPETA